MWRRDAHLRYCSPTPKILIFGVVLLVFAGLTKAFEYVVLSVVKQFHISVTVDFTNVIMLLIGLSGSVIMFAILERIFRSSKRDIKYIVRKRLCDVSYGNPLCLKDGELEPSVSVSKTDKGYQITIDCISADFDSVSSLENVISGCLRNKYRKYAVVAKEEDIAGIYVDYFIEDVVSNYNKQSVYSSLADVPSHLTKVYIREDVYIDYARVLNSSAIVAGKSRSGKTTGIISVFLLPMLKQGRDDFGSRIIIVDPKSAELSLSPHVLAPASDGSVEHIFDAIKEFNQVRVERQKIINEYCKREGHAVKWFDVKGMKASLLFIDEYIALQEMFPRKPSKDKPDYSLSDFQGLIRQIATQGASAGMFLCISVAQASVGTGGLESAVNSACGIRILFKPSLDEARFLWSSKALEVMRERQYSAGDAWVSADDGINNSVRFIKFPRLEFGEYEALSKLLSLYYNDTETHGVEREATSTEAMSPEATSSEAATREAGGASVADECVGVNCEGTSA